MAFAPLELRLRWEFEFPAKPRYKSADVVRGQNQRYYAHLKRIDEGITTVVVKDVDRPSIVV
jgi:hypothetical protein